MGANRDALARAEIDGDGTQESAAIPTTVLERYVDVTNQRLITRDAGEQTVFDVGLKLVGDEDVFARQPKRAHHRFRQMARQRHYVVSSYSFIFRQSVTGLM